MPFLETLAAARRRRVLRDEDGVPARGRLLAVANRIGWSQAPRDEVRRVLEDGPAALQVQQRALFGTERELRAKPGAGQRLEKVFGFPQPPQPSSAVGP